LASRRSSRQESDESAGFSPTLFIVLLVISTVLTIFDRPADRSDAFGSFRAGFTDIVAPILELAAQPIRGVKGIGPYFRNQGDLARENAEMREELIAARGWVELAERQRDQIEIYEAALNVETPEQRPLIRAWTVADSSGPFVHARLIGSGRNVGIANGYPVVNDYGLVGRIFETGRRSARILLLTDINSRIPVMADRSNARAIMVGDNSDYPRLDYVGRIPDIVEGDRIVTSGDDGVLPRGLPIGEAVPTRDGGWRIQLFSSQAPVDFVYVWPFDRIVGPEADVAKVPDMPVENSAAEPESDPVSDSVSDSGLVADVGAETAGDASGDVPLEARPIGSGENARTDGETTTVPEDGE